MANFVAIDFETADYGSDSACAMGLVRVESGRIVERRYQLLKPPRNNFLFSYIHGISWHMVTDQPTFKQAWPDLRTMLDKADFIAAHNASFDRSVLYACCTAAGFSRPEYSFVCTVQLARRSLGIRPANLSNVCRELSIPLQHHFALSDAEACARIVLQAESRESVLQR